MSERSTLLPEWLGRRARLTPDKAALISGSAAWTFRQLNEAADAAARWLVASSSWVVDDRYGPRIGLLMGNTPRFVVFVHALAKAGAVLVPLNTRLTPGEMASQLEDAGAAAVIYDRLHADAAGQIGQLLPSLQLIHEADVQELPPGSDSRLRTHFSLDDLHSIVYTSGTTGRAKGAMLTYGNFWFNATASALNLGHLHDDRWLACMPLFHVGGLSILLRSVLSGMTVVLHDGFHPVAVNDAIDEERITLLSVVAVMLGRMLDERGDEPYPPSLRAVLLGGGPAPLPLLERASRVGMRVLQTYGLTEAASQVATMAPHDGPERLGAAGKPLFPVGLRIVPVGEKASRLDDDVAADEIGEIAIAGPTVSPGYWNDPESSRAVRHEGWFRTGDLGFLDEAGYLHVVDRRNDLIISGGENVYPAEVESVLAAHVDIEHAAVVGVADEKWGQVPAAVVVRREGSRLTEEDIRQFCKKHLAGYKVPRCVVFKAQLPRNSAGKVLRRQLREMLQEVRHGPQGPTGPTR